MAGRTQPSHIKRLIVVFMVPMQPPRWHLRVAPLTMGRLDEFPALYCVRYGGPRPPPFWEAATVLRPTSRHFLHTPPPLHRHPPLVVFFAFIPLTHVTFCTGLTLSEMAVPHHGVSVELADGLHLAAFETSFWPHSHPI